MPPLPEPFSIHHRLSDWLGCTLEIRCQCGRAAMPSILMLIDRRGDQSFASMLPRLRCEACNAPPTTIWLVAGHHRTALGGPPADWAVELGSRLMP